MGRRLGAAALAVVAMGVASLSTPPTAEAAQPAPPPTVPTGNQGGNLKAEYDEVLGREVELLARLEAAQTRRIEATFELDRLEEDLASRRVQLVVATEELEEAEAAAEREARALALAEIEVAVAEERLRTQIVSSYVTGGQDASMMEALLSAESTDDADLAMAYSQAVVGDTDRLVRDLEQARARRREADRVAKAARTAATAHRDQVADAATFVSAARDGQAALLEEIDVQVMAEAQALHDVQARKALVEGRINSMNRTSDGVSFVLADFQRGQPDFVPGDIETSSPIPGYRIGSRFGPRLHPILNITRLHAGGDIGAPSGTPIYAPADGLVVLAGPRGGYGNTTVIDHGNSLGTLHAHQSRIDVEAGQMVARGDRIGLVGSTGLSTGPHLHFETRIKGMPIDPEGVIDWENPLPDAEDRDERASRPGG